MNIYVCGNPLVEDDALPLKILPILRALHPSLQFIEFDPTEELPPEETLVIIDTVINAKEVSIITNIDTFVLSKGISLHDFDLGMNLTIAKKMGWLNKVVIIGVPPQMNEKEAISMVSNILITL